MEGNEAKENKEETIVEKAMKELNKAALVAVEDFKDVLDLENCTEKEKKHRIGIATLFFKRGAIWERMRKVEEYLNQETKQL